MRGGEKTIDLDVNPVSPERMKGPFFKGKTCRCGNGGRLSLRQKSTTGKQELNDVECAQRLRWCDISALQINNEGDYRHHNRDTQER